MKNILVTGGAGYIGSHTVVELINAGLASGEKPRRRLKRHMALATKHNKNKLRAD
jgi:nucleoside-diphosphate-sugar epimerase